MKNRFSHPHFTIKKGIHGIGVFSTTDFKRGEILFHLTGEILTEPTRTTVQIGKHKHIEDLIGGHVNHSCAPNAKVSKRSQSFVSTKQIHRGEEITFNYNQNEDLLASPFKCACCGRKIRGRAQNSHLKKNYNARRANK